METESESDLSERPAETSDGVWGGAGAARGVAGAWPTTWRTAAAPAEAPPGSAAGVGDVELTEQGDICEPKCDTSISGDWSMESGVSSADGLKLPSADRPSSGDGPRRPPLDE